MRAGLTLAILASVQLSCGSLRATGESDVRENVYGEEEASRGVTVGTSGEHRDLAAGRAALRAGKYEEAIAAFTRAYRDSPKHEEKEQALFALSETHSHLLNPRKDYGQARHYLEVLLRDFPETPLRERAEQKLSALRSLAY